MAGCWTSTDVIVPPKFTESDLGANRTLLVGRILVRNFGKLGSFKGVVSSYDAVHEEYRVDFSANNTYELLGYDQVCVAILVYHSWMHSLCGFQQNHRRLHWVKTETFVSTESATRRVGCAKFIFWCLLWSITMCGGKATSCLSPVVPQECVCGAGYQPDTEKSTCLPCDVGYFKGSASAGLCERCEDESYSQVQASVACEKCDMNSLFSQHPGSAVIECNTCPRSVQMLLVLVQRNVIDDANVFPVLGSSAVLFSSNVASVRRFMYVNSVSKCRSKIRVSNVSDMLLIRAQCKKGEYATKEHEDVDTLCAQCPFGTYNDVAGSLECKQRRICSGLYWDATAQPLETTGATQDSDCRMDSKLNTNAMQGKYPTSTLGGVTTQRQLLNFASHRTFEFTDYIQCSKPESSENSLCAASTESCVDDFLSQWQNMKTAVLIMPSVIKCMQTCASGYVFETNNARCVACAPGKYKSDTGKAQGCEPCASGQFSSVTAAHTCKDCDTGKFAYNRTLCVNMCIPKREYTRQDPCYTTTPSFILRPTNNSRAINVYSCAHGVSQDNWLDKMQGASVQENSMQWASFGVDICSSWTGQATRNECVRGQYLVPGNSTVVNSCKACDQSFAYLREIGCTDDQYLQDATECGQRENAICIPCTRQQYQELDYSQIFPGLWKQSDRCKFKCVDMLATSGSKWFYLNSNDAQKMLPSANFSGTSNCVRSEVRASFSPSAWTTRMCECS